jgi:hypothetical protein
MNAVFYVVRAEELSYRKLGGPSHLSVGKQFCTERYEDRIRAREAEEYPLLEAVTRERLKRQQAR